MVERGVKILCANHLGCAEPCDACWTKAYQFILAMREPTQHMLGVAENEAVGHCWGSKGEFITKESAENLFQVMIDAALK